MPSRPTGLIVAFVDVDYLRGSHAHGSRHVGTRGPETFLCERVGIVWCHIDDSEQAPALSYDRDELVQGRFCVSQTIQRLRRADIVIGHGLLSTDYRAFNMVTEVPGELVDKTIDLLYLLHEVRRQLVKSGYPTGLGLSGLARHNLATPRAKAPVPTRANPRIKTIAPHGRDAAAPDARDDAYVVSRLWSTLLATGVLTWGDGQDGYTSEMGHGWTGRPGQTVALAPATMTALRTPGTMTHSSWIQALLTGRILTGAPSDPDAGQLAALALDFHRRPDLPGTRRVAANLHRAGLLRHVPRSTEDLCSALQHLGPGIACEVRMRESQGRNLTQVHQRSVGWALWRNAHREQTQAWINMAPLRHGSAHSYMRWAESEQQRLETKQRVEEAAITDSHS